MNVPEAVGVPLMVITLEAQAAVTPAGRPVAAPIPVAPVVLCVMFVKTVLIHKVCVELAAPTAKGVSPVMVHPLPPLPVARTKLALAAVAVGP